MKIRNVCALLVTGGLVGMIGCEEKKAPAPAPAAPKVAAPEATPPATPPANSVPATPDKPAEPK